MEADIQPRGSGTYFGEDFLSIGESADIQNVDAVEARDRLCQYSRIATAVPVGNAVMEPAEFFLVGFDEFQVMAGPDDARIDFIVKQTSAGISA